MSLNSQESAIQAQHLKQAFETEMKRAQSMVEKAKREHRFGSTKDKQHIQNYAPRLKLLEEQFEALHIASSTYDAQRSELVD